MAGLKGLSELVEHEPELWIPGALFLGGSVGFVFWSFRTAAAAIIGLCLLLIIYRFRRLYPFAWCLLWALVWFEYGRSVLTSLDRHPHILDRLPTYAGAAICAYFWLGWMGTAVLLARQRLGAGQRGDSPGQPKEEPAPMAPAPERFEPYRVLELSPDASQRQIKAAYRRLMALYHPDKVAHLGDDIKVTAIRKTFEIGHAYEILTKPH